MALRITFALTLSPAESFERMNANTSAVLWTVGSSPLDAAKLELLPAAEAAVAVSGSDLGGGFTFFAVAVEEEEEEALEEASAAALDLDLTLDLAEPVVASIIAWMCWRCDWMFASYAARSVVTNTEAKTDRKTMER